MQIRSFGLLPGPNFHAPGGRVIVVDGDYFADEALHTQLNRASTEAKNTPIDFLYCVPPSLVSSDSDANRYSLPGMLLTEWGASVWDGVDAKVRQTIPCDNNAFRVITYDSCRGLEGWTCVLLALDDFYNHKMRVFDADEGGAADTPEEMAGLWSLVAMLRAMDTLVITLSSSSPSPVRDRFGGRLPSLPRLHGMAYASKRVIGHKKRENLFEACFLMWHNQTSGWKRMRLNHAL